MKIGVLKEIKESEFRVCMTPSGVHELSTFSHEVFVETQAGVGVGFQDSDYKNAGAKIVNTPEEIYNSCDMILHVKELQESEYHLIKENQIIFTYLHLAADEALTRALIKAKPVAIAYETVELSDGSLPLLAPMSEIAGKMSSQEAAKYLEKHYGGLGVLFGGVPGVERASVIIIGGGVVGYNTAITAAGLGANVIILDKNIQRLRYLDEILPKNVQTLTYSHYTLQSLLPKADAVIGAVLVKGAKAPKLLTKKDLSLMKKGSVVVDVAIDQGGCFETSKPTKHNNPIYEVDGIIHYCVANIPGAVARTSTMAITNATLPYIVNIANKGYKKACQDDPALAKGINVIDGKITYKGVSDAFNMDYYDIKDMLK
jgi:alanine dehydrogenase